MGDSSKDSRFAHIANDPRFKTIPRAQRQVKIDKRFQAMFKDKRFKMKYTVDKRGRPMSRTSNEDLERFYALSSGSSDSEDDDDGTDNPSLLKDKSITKKKVPKKTKVPESKNAEEDEPSDSESDSIVGSAEEGSKSEASEGSDEEIRSDDEQLTDKMKSKLKDMSVDYARGEGAIMSDSSSDEESSDDDADVTVEHGWGELDRDADRTDEVTSRLALCNMDWDRIRAVDLMVLLSSFAPAGGLVRSVTIYPSEFGLERMKKEEEEGPPELVEKESKERSQQQEDNSSDEDVGFVPEEHEEGSNYHMEKLRKYQLNRLKYFYAVVECDSGNTANHIYTECDGMEYESSATRLDLRFIPDDTDFDQEPRERCTEMPDTSKYRPRQFTTTALQQAKVQLTWDETDPTRTEIANRLMAGENVDDNDVRAYLASSSGEEDSPEETESKPKKGIKSNGCSSVVKNSQTSACDSKEDQESDEGNSDGGEDLISKYRSLLTGIEEAENEKKNKEVHMEISWGLGLKEKTEEAVKKRLSKTEKLTPFQEMMEKRKQKRKEKKQQKLQQKMKSGSGDENGEENSDSDDDIPSDIDMNDPYFAEEFKDLKKNSKKKTKKWKCEMDETEEERQKKAELELLLLEKDDTKHFNFKKIQEEESSNPSKRKKKAWRKKEKDGVKPDSVTDDFKVDVDDNRFSALFSSHHFNIDPTDSHFRKSQGMEALISAKHKRLADPSQQILEHVPSPLKKSKRDAELSLLVKSVKNKAQKLKHW